MVNVVGFKDVFIVASCFLLTKVIDFQSLLKDFIAEMKILESIGFDYGNKTIGVTMRSVICDSDARAKVLGVKSHSGYFSCTKCTIRLED